MNDISVPSPRDESARQRETIADTRCIYCLEDIRPGASVCSHCGGVLIPFQRLINERAALEARLAALEDEVAALRAIPIATPLPENVSAAAEPAPAWSGGFRWPHMVDNLFLGLIALLATHWLATTLPHANRMVFRLAALAVATPFGYRFEYYARSHFSGQVLSALALGVLGSICVGVLDIALAGGMPEDSAVQDAVASVAAITLSHLAGSLWAVARRRHIERPTPDTATAQGASGSIHSVKTISAIHLVKPEKIQSSAAAVKAVTDAAAAVATGAIALWAAFGRILS